MTSSNMKTGTIFSGQKRVAFEKEQAAKFTELSSSEKLWASFQKFGKYALLVAFALLAIFLTLEILVGNYVYKFTASLASEYDWLGGWIEVISFTFAVVLAWPLLWAILNCAVGRRKLKHWATLAICLFSVLLSAYAARDVYFADGVPQKEICRPTDSDEFPNISLIGKGETKGQVCDIITKENIGMAKRVRKSKAPQEIKISTSRDVANLKLFINGTPALYRSIDSVDGFYKFYDGPWFDDDTGKLLIQVKSRDELSAMKVILQARELKAAAKKIAEDDAKKKEAERAESEKKAADAKSEAMRIAKQKALEEKIAEAKGREERVGLANVESWTVKYGWRISVKGRHVQLKLPGDPPGTNREMTDDLFKKNNGKVIAVPMSCLWCSETWLKIEPLILD